MMLPEDEIVVLDLAGDYVRIFCKDPKYINSLLALGFHVDGDQLVKPIVEDAERQQLIHELIKLRAVFSAGRDWSPAELLDYYREQGIVRQSYRVIAWRGQDSFQIRDC